MHNDILRIVPTESTGHFLFNEAIVATDLRGCDASIKELLEKMTITQLRTFLADWGFGVKGKPTKSELIENILKSWVQILAQVERQLPHFTSHCEGLIEQKGKSKGKGVASASSDVQAFSGAGYKLGEANEPKVEETIDEDASSSDDVSEPEKVQTNDTLLVWTEDKEHALMMLELLNSRAGIGVNPDELWRLREEKKKATAPSPDDEADYERMVRVLKEEGIWDKTVIIHIVSQNAEGITKTTRTPIEWKQTMSVDDLYEAVAKMMKVESNGIKLYHRGKAMTEHYRRVAEYAVGEDKNIYVGLKLKAGGVRRTIQKKPKKTIPECSKETFEGAFTIAQAMKEVEKLSLAGHLEDFV